MHTMSMIIPKTPRIVTMLVDIPVAAFLLLCIVALRFLAILMSTSHIMIMFRRIVQKKKNGD